MGKMDLEKPYCFIPLEEKCARYDGIGTGEKFNFLTGYFECILEPLSPLFIPAAAGVSISGENDDTAEFFSYDGRGIIVPPEYPVIPGSEIRGTVRSVFEVISNSCMSTTFYGKEELEKVNTILKTGGGYQPCSFGETLCMACSVFGMTAKEKTEEKRQVKKIAVGSRVRFTDAVLKDRSDQNFKLRYMKPWKLGPTASPQPEKAQIYTVKPKQLAEKITDESRAGWDYNEYWFIKEGQRFPLKDDEPELQGRKFYRHSDTWKKRKDRKAKEGDMFQKIRPLKAINDEGGEKNIFHFRVYFEKLTKSELEYLRWSLDFLDRGNTFAHKMGRGKPYGLGSVKIKIEEVRLRTLDPDSGTLDLIPAAFEEWGKSVPTDREAVRKLRKAADWKNRLEEVGYPVFHTNAKGKGRR